MMQPSDALQLIPAGTPAGAVASYNSYMPVMSMDLVVQRRNMVVQFTKSIMVEGLDKDYGTIPGTQKPTLLKAGAEKLNNFFGLEPEYSEVAEILDWTGAEHAGEPLYYIRYACKLSKDGRVWGSGEGSANSREAKHRYRWVAETELPAEVDKDKLKRRGGMSKKFEPDFAISKKETGGKYGKPQEHWDRFDLEISAGRATRDEKVMGGKKFKGWTIQVDEVQFRIPNPDFADLINSLQKVAQKRSYVAATLGAVGASEFFTQDVEDMAGFGQPVSTAPAAPEPAAEHPEAPPAPAAAPAPPAAPPVVSRPAPAAAPTPKLGERWNGQATFLVDMATEKNRLGSKIFTQILGNYGYERAEDIGTRTVAVKVYKEVFNRADPPKGQITNAHGTTVDNSDVPFPEE
jgi:hypothetical protein